MIIALDGDRRVRDQRLIAGARYARNKVVARENATAPLEAVIRSGDRVCLEGDNQKQADLLASLSLILWPEAVAAVAERALILEVATWPKPGLVSDVDSGSHTDMDAATYRRSAAVIRPFFCELAATGLRNGNMSQLRKIGLPAERAMFKPTQGVNTHRGAIFGLGLLCAAAGLWAAGLAPTDVPLGQLVSWRWGRDIMAGPRLLGSHGELAGRRYGAGGARLEAERGFPSLYEIGLPWLTTPSPANPLDDGALRVQACFALIAVLEDTNLLPRTRIDGLHFAQRTA